MEGILGRASRMVAPPLTMSYNAGSDLKGKLKRHFSGEAGHFETPVPSSGVYRAADVRKEEDSISDRLKKTGISSRSKKEPRHSEPAPEPPPDINSRMQKASKHTFDESAKGHAHDVTKDRLFVDVGQGPCNKDEEQAPPEDHHHDYVVSESPTQTDESVFETAYQREVESIQNSGRASTIFSTRRIDKSEGQGEEGQTASGRGELLRSTLGTALGKAMQSGGSKLQQRYADRKGSAPA